MSCQSESSHDDVEQLYTLSLNDNLDEILNESCNGEDSKIEQVLKLDDIAIHMNEAIEKVNSVVEELNPTITRLLLDNFQWNTERFIEAFYDESKESLLKRANITCDLLLSYNLQTTQVGNCEICLSDNVELIEFGCLHPFCYQCWASYISKSILDDGKCYITCAASDCNLFFDDATIAPLLSDEKTINRYEQNKSNGFVVSNKNLRWCPRPNCGCAIKVDYSSAVSVRCRCETTFCFRCGEDPHEPIDCELLVDWMAKCKGESETLVWIVAHTRKCPKCQANIEKNGGCNHMTCRQCSYEFCWLCLSNWNAHRNCSSYVEPENVKEFKERLDFFRNRYANQLESLKLDRELIGKAQLDKTILNGRQINEAIRVLGECRQTLMNTYVFAFYHKRNHQLQIFEDNQRDLENLTENLSEQLEKYTVSTKNHKTNGIIRDRFRYCEYRRRVLLDHIKEGHEQDWWTNMVADFGRII